MDAFNRFSIEDFLAYFFPGVIGSAGIFLLLLLTPLKGQLITLPINLTLGVVFLIWSYVFGIILAGLSTLILRIFDKTRKFDDPRKSVPFPEIEKGIINAYKSAFRVDDVAEVKWSTTQFYLCRFLVESYVPNASLFIRRQISLRRLRENLMPTVLIWGLAGFFWGIRCFLVGLAWWGIALVSLSLLLSPLILNVLFKSWYGNYRREVREVCTALLVGVNTGAFRKLDKGAEASAGEKST